MSPRCLCLIGTLSVGCITVKAVTIGQKTALERQLMGELEPLTDEELLISSVRAPSPAISDGARALVARRRQLFNRDDIDELKASGCLGEAPQAILAPHPCDMAGDPARALRRERLLREENADRATIIDWVVTTDATLTPRDRPQVAALYRGLLLQQAREGDWIQQDEGAWTQR